MNNGGRSFDIQVDPTQLQSGFHFEQILGYDSTAMTMGPLFRIPITICKPEIQKTELNLTNSQEMNSFKLESIQFSPGTIKRYFINVPLGSNFVEMILHTKKRATPARLIVHLIQLQDVCYNNYLAISL